jgi:hypothetical protein
MGSVFPFRIANRGPEQIAREDLPIHSMDLLFGCDAGLVSGSAPADIADASVIVDMEADGVPGHGYRGYCDRRLRPWSSRRCSAGPDSDRGPAHRNRGVAMSGSVV